MTHNEVTDAILNAALHVHRSLGPGLLESVYLHVLAHELRKRGLRVVTQVGVPVVWEGIQLEVGFRADLLVEGMVVVELKSIEAVAPVHKKQVLTYLRLMDLRVGLLINFGAETLRGGVSRIVNNYQGERPGDMP